MAIARLETLTRGNASVVRLTADDGAVGIGQLSPYNADVAATVFHRQVAPHALGREVDELETLVEEIVERNLKFPGSYVRRALCGLDTAAWDLRGKRRGAPVWELVDGGVGEPLDDETGESAGEAGEPTGDEAGKRGDDEAGKSADGGAGKRGGGDRGELRAYASSMRRDIPPEAEAERLAALRDERGFEAFKVRVGGDDSVGDDEDQWSGRSEAVVEACRERLGPDAALFVDANSAYTPGRAVELEREVLAPNDVAHFEEPCPYWELDWTARVREAAETPVAGGEQDCFLPRWERIVERPVVDVVQPDVCYVGGLTRALEVAELAAERGLPCRPHCANHSMVLPFTLHLLAAVDHAAPYVEYSVEDHWAEGMLDPAPSVEDGRIAVPDRPGWGVGVAEAWLADAEREVSAA